MKRDKRRMKMSIKIYIDGESSSSGDGYKKSYKSKYKTKYKRGKYNKKKKKDASMGLGKMMRMIKGG